MTPHQEEQLLGFMSRLTDAAEHGTVTRRQLEHQLRYAQERVKSERTWREELQVHRERLHRSNVALRGVITKLQRRLAESKA